MDFNDFIPDPFRLEGSDDEAVLPISQAIIAGVCVAIFVSLFVTRVLRTLNPHGGITPITHPYWIPFFGHAGRMAIGADGFLAGLRDWYPGGAFSLWILGKTHTIVHKPSLASVVLNQPAHVADRSWSRSRLLVTTFGLRKKDLDLWMGKATEVDETHKYFLSEPYLGNMTSTTIKNIKENIANFVSFNSYIADQTDWERLADTQVIESEEGEPVVEASLMDLTRNFIASTANAAIFGSDFAENFPDAWEQLWKFDDGFMLLSTGVPTWIPVPGLPRAVNARRKLIGYFYEFQEAMERHSKGEDPGARWQDLDNVSQFIKRRSEECRERGMSLEGRAVFDFSMAWAANANLNNLIPWMLFEIYRDPVFLEQVREEIAPFVQIEQPKNEFGAAVWVPPELNAVDLDGLLTKCPLLKASYIETLRVYAESWAVKWLTEDVLLEERGKGGGESYLLKKNTYVHVPHGMHQRDPAAFPNPEEWNAERHLKEQVDDAGKRVKVADMGTLRPYSAGPAMCKGRTLALREMLLYAAVIISFYDMGNPGGGSWEAPSTTRRTGSRHPSRPLKAWIRRRKFSVVDEKGELADKA